MEIMFTVEGHKVCNWNEVKKAVIKNSPKLTEDSLARPLIEIILKLIEFNIISKGLKEIKGGKK